MAHQSSSPENSYVKKDNLIYIFIFLSKKKDFLLLICCSVHDVQSMRIASYLIILSFFLSEVTLALNLSACLS